VACGEASDRKVSCASDEWNGSARYAVSRLSRPNRVMNQGNPAAKSRSYGLRLRVEP
jgi:hypothetical protein